MLAGSVLELDHACPDTDIGNLMPVPFTARVASGDCIMIECRRSVQASAFSDFCSGMIPLSAGAVRFMGLDWSELGSRQMDALRGRIGRVALSGYWPEQLGVQISIMMRGLHHTTRSIDDISAEALRLAIRFGLPGLPIDPPYRLDRMDLIRAACVRAFLGSPGLVLIEDFFTAANPVLLPPLLHSIEEIRQHGSAVLWFVSNASSHDDYRLIRNGLWHLSDDGLVTG
ncbi:MAG: ABC transporter ATP-binding protein [Acetobacter sp.]|nr:ABC transporter ATP-binding protein [Acetobacter sp.]